MTRFWIPAIAALLLTGCGVPSPRNSIPVIDGSGRNMGNAQQPQRQPVPPAVPAASQVQVMAQPVGSGLTVSPAPAIQPLSTGSAPLNGSVQPVYPASVPAAISAPSSYPPSGSMSPSPALQVPQPIIHREEPASLPAGSSLPGNLPSSASSALPASSASVQTLLVQASSQQASGNPAEAISILDRAQRIEPNNPQILQRLGELHLSQGNPVQAESLAFKGLSNAGNNPGLQSGLWDLIARCRTKMNNPSGAAEARQRAQAM